MNQQLQNMMRWWRQCRTNAGSGLAWGRWSSALALGFLLLAPLVSQTAMAAATVKTKIVFVGATPGDKITILQDRDTGLSTFTPTFSLTASASGGNNGTSGASASFDFTLTTPSIRFGSIDFGPGNAANYSIPTNAFVCTNGSFTQNIAPQNTVQLSTNLNGGTVICTVTATYQSVKLVLQKTWINGYSGDSSTIGATTGYTTNIATVANNTAPFITASDGSPSNTVSMAPLTLRVSATGTLPLDSFTIPSNAANYQTGDWVCKSGATTVATVAQGASFTIPNNLANNATITCTVTSTNQTAKLIITKIWNNGNNNDGATMNSSQGFLNNTAPFTSYADGTANLASNTQSGTSIFIPATGASGRLPTETFVAGNISNYTSSGFSCVYGSPPTTMATITVGGVFSIAGNIAGQTVTCTDTDKIKMLNMSLENLINYGHPGDVLTLPAVTTGFNTPELKVTATGGSPDVGNSPGVPIKAGSTGTLPVETFTLPANAAFYVPAKYSCNYASTFSTAFPVDQGATITLPPIPVGSPDFVCILNNVFQGVTLVLTDTVINAKPGDSLNLPPTTGMPQNTSLVSISSSNPTASTSIVVRSGAFVILPTQTYGPGTLASNYTTPDYVCSDGGLNPQFTVAQGALFNLIAYPNNPPVTVTCALSNTLKPISLVIKEVSVGAVGTFDFAMTGILNDSDSLTTATSGVAVTSALTNPGKANQAVTIIQTPVAGYVNSASCVDTNGVSPTQTFSSGNVTLPAASIVPGNAWVCTFTNSYTQPRVAISVISKGATGTFGFSLAGLSPLDDSMATSTDSGAAVVSNTLHFGTIGTPASINLTSYSPAGFSVSSISCTDSGVGSTPINVSGNNKVTLPASAMVAGAIWTCAYQIILAPQLTLNATLTRIKSTDQFALAIKSGSTPVASIDTSIGMTTPSTIVDSISYTLSASASGTSTFAAYSVSYSCSNAYTGANGTKPFSNTGAAFSFTPQSGDLLTCTFFIVPAAPTLKLSKALIGARVVATDQFTLAIKNGASAVASMDTGGTLATVTAGGSASPLVGSGLAAGTPYTISEVGASASATAISNYTSTYSCLNATASSSTGMPSGNGQSFPLTLAAGDIISCVITNQPVTAQLVLKKTWVNGLSGNAVTIPATTFGTLAFNFSSTGLAIESSPPPAVPVAVNINTSGILPFETFTSGTSSNYVASDYVCTDGTVTNTVVQGGTLTIPIASANKTITCTLTNSRVPANVTIATKSIGGTAAFAFTLTGLNNATDNLTTLVAGNSVSSLQVNTGIGAATITETLNANYTTAVSCADSNSAITGNNTPLTSPNNAITLPALNMKPNAQYVCTFTNTLKPQLTTTATISSLVTATDKFSLTSSAAGPVATNGTSSMNSGPFAATVGTAYILGITTSSGTFTVYDSSYSCSNAYTGTGATAAIPLTSGSSVTVTPVSGDAITCAFTVTPKKATLTLSASLGGSRVMGDQFTVQILNPSGVLMNATTTSTTTGSGSVVNSGTGSTGPTLLLPGTQYTFNLIGAGTPPATLGNYSTTFFCSNGLNSFSSTSFTLTPHAAENISCNFVITSSPPKLTLLKSFGSNGRMIPNDQFILRILKDDGSVLVSGATTTGSGNALTGSGGAISAYQLEANTTYTLSEIGAGFTILSNYTGSIACSNTLSGGTVGPSGIGRTFTLTPQVDDNITCVFNDNPLAGSLVLQNKWVNGQPGDSITLAATTGFKTNTAPLTSNATVSSTDSTAAVQVVINQSGTLPSESFASNSSHYMVGPYLCTDGVTSITVLQGGILTMPASSAGVTMTCTLTTTKRPQLILNLTLDTPPSSGSSQLQITPGGALATTTNSSDTTLTTATFYGAIGTTYTFTETGYSGANGSNYDMSYSCTNAYTGPGAASPAPGAGNSFSVTPTASDILTCSFVGKLKYPKITLVAALSGSRALAGDQFTMQILNNASAVINATTTSTTQGSGGAITAATGTTGVTRVVDNQSFALTEVAAGTTVISDYQQSIACSNTNGSSTTLLPSGFGTDWSIVPQNSDVIVCTITSAAKTGSLILRKTWVNGNLGDTATLPATTGFASSNTPPLVFAATGLASESLSTPAVTVTVDSSTLLPQETIDNSVSGSVYTVGNGYVCDDDSGSGPFTVAQGAALNISSSTIHRTMLCTLTNTRVQQLSVNLVLAERVVSSDQFTLGITGGPTATTSGSVLGLGVGPFKGTVATSYTMSLSPATSTEMVLYDTSYSCVNASRGTGATPNKSGTGASVTFPLGLGDVFTCTFTVQPKAPTLKLVGALGNNRLLASDQFTLQINNGATLQNGAASSTTTGVGSVVTPGSGTTGVTPIVAGTSYTLTEIGAGTTLLTRYDSAISCTNTYNGNRTGVGQTILPTGSGQTFSISALSGDAITCTLTNTPKSAVLVLQKTWVNGQVGDAVLISATTGFAANSLPLSSIATGGASSSVTTAVSVLVGATGSLPTEGFTAGLAAAYTNNGFVCFDGTTTVNVAQGGSLTIPSTSAATTLTCTLTNTFKGLPQVRVMKTTVNGSGSNTFNFALTGLSAASDSITLTGASTGTGATSITGAVGAAATLTELLTSGWPANPASANCVDVNSATPAATFGTLLANQLSVPAAKMVAGADIRCTFTNNFSLIVTGQVFIDNGAGSGTANDGVMNGAEAGQGGVLMQLTNCSGAILNSTNTDATGHYSLVVPNATAIGGSLCVLETNSGVRLSTGASVAATVLPSGTPIGIYTYTRETTPDQIALLWNGSGHTGLNFGDVDVSTLSANSPKSGPPNTAVIYPHTFTAGTGGSVSFSVSSEVAVPVGAWSTIIFADPTCSGALQAGAVQLYPPTVATVVTAGQIVCILLQERIAVTAVTGNTDDLKLLATMSFSNAAPALSASYTVDDITSVTAGVLALSKEVRNVTQSGSFGLSNQAKSGETLEYRITYINNGSAPISNLVINDLTPPYTTFVSSSLGGGMPGALTACVKNTPANPLPAAGLDCGATQTSGGTGAVDWTFIGALNPNASGAVLFSVKVN